MNGRMGRLVQGSVSFPRLAFFFAVTATRMTVSRTDAEGNINSGTIGLGPFFQDVKENIDIASHH